MAIMKRQKAVDQVPPSVLAALANDPEAFEAECQRWLDAKTAADKAQAALLNERNQYEQERQRRESELRQRAEAMVADQKRLDAARGALTLAQEAYERDLDELHRGQEAYLRAVEAKDNEWADRLNSLERDRNAMTAQTRVNEVERDRLAAWAEALETRDAEVSRREGVLKGLVSQLA